MPRGETKHLKPHQFKKGAPSANPEGGRRHNPALKKLKQVTTQQYCDLIEAICFQSSNDVLAIANDKTEDNLLGTLAQCWMDARKKGDYATIRNILAEVLGKIPETVNINSRNLNANFNAEIDEAKVKAALAKFKSGI